MKKEILITLFAMLICASTIGQNVDVNKQNLCKKWNLEKYEIFWIDYDPEEIEKNDYINLKSDMTYESIDEGVYGTGTWDFITGRKDDYLVLKDEKEEIKLIIDDLEKDKLVLLIDDEELIDVEIHFKAN